MKSIKKSLKLINEKLGGTNDANDHFKSLIDEISDKIDSGGGGGGSDLPPVTSDDNGDVLTVVDGAWDKAAPSGGSVGVPYIVNVVEEGTVWTCESTWAQIKAAYLMGQQVRFNLPVSYEGDFNLEPLVGIYKDNSQPDWPDCGVGVFVRAAGGPSYFHCSSEDDYPYVSFD